MNDGNSIRHEDERNMMNTDYIDLGSVDLTRPSTSNNDKNTDDDVNGDGVDGDDTSAIRLLQLTDLHIFPKTCESFKGVPLHGGYDRCLQLIDHLVTTVRPDVIVLTGDIVDGRGPWNGKGAFAEVWHDLIPRFGGTPWMYVPGNHDDDGSPWTRVDLLQILKLPGCLQRRSTGFHHTVLLRKGNNDDIHDEDNDTVTRVRLHMMDSGGNDPDPKVMYECTPRKTVEGFLQFARRRRRNNNKDDDGNDDDKKSIDTKDRDVPEIVFLHIPLPEYQHLDPVVGTNNLFEAALAGGKIPFPLDRMAWLIRLCKLDRIAGCRRGDDDSGLFGACARANRMHRGRIIALFCGHDHHSDAVFWKPNENIFLGYGRSGSTTPPFDWEGKAPNTLQPGGRVIRIDSNGNVTTWIKSLHGREEDSFLDMVSTTLGVTRM